jgi:hypothetical protein
MEPSLPGQMTYAISPKARWGLFSPGVNKNAALNQ